MNRRALIVEHNISKRKLTLISESIGGFENFHKLPTNKQVVIGHAVLSELAYLHHHKMLTEDFLQDITSFFKSPQNAINSLVQTLFEPVLNSYLKGLGIPDVISLPIIAYFTQNPIKVLRSFTSCEKFSEMFIQAMIEALIMHIQKNLKIGSGVFDFIRNSTIEAIKASDLGDKLMDKFGNQICQLFNKIKSKIPSFGGFLK